MAALWDWEDLTGTVGPNQPQRQDFSMEYDPIRNYAIMSGGIVGETPSVHYKFDVASRYWYLYTSSVLEGRQNPISFWDPIHNRICHGYGIGSPSYKNDLYYWDHSANDWVLITQTNPPPAASKHCVSWDSKRRKLIWWGGEPSTGQKTYECDLNTYTWTDLSGSISGYPGLAQHCQLLYDPVHDVHYMFGGFSGGGYYQEVWKLDLNAMTWTNVTSLITYYPGEYDLAFNPGAPPFMMWDEANQQIIKVGGHDGSDSTPFEPQIDVIIFDPVAMTATYQSCTGDPTPGFPTATGPHNRWRANSFGFYVPSEDNIYIACGRHSPSTVYADTWVMGVPSLPITYTTGYDRVFVVAKDVIKLIFNTDVAVTSSLSNPSTYTINSLSGGSEVSVTGVLPIEGDTTTFVFLEITKPTWGQQYEILIDPDTIYDPDGEAFDGRRTVWIHKRTKVDSVVDGMPLMYGMTRRTTIRSISEAISIVDEEIGGDFSAVTRIEPAEAAPTPSEDEIPDTWGAGGKWGYSTW